MLTTESPSPGGGGLPRDGDEPGGPSRNRGGHGGRTRGRTRREDHDEDEYREHAGHEPSPDGRPGTGLRARARTGTRSGKGARGERGAGRGPGGLGHALSVVTVQASAARRVIGRDPAFAAQALADIETVSRQAAGELDHVLGLLRDEARRATAPAPSLDALDELVALTRAAGLAVEQGDLSRLPPLISREAYRIVQEGLTNALKYSPDRTAALGLSLGRDGLGIRLSNPVPARRGAQAGRGLRGITERAAALGGTAAVGATGPEWTLSVTLPVPEGRS